MATAERKRKPVKSKQAAPASSKLGEKRKQADLKAQHQRLLDEECAANHAEKVALLRAKLDAKAAAAGKKAGKKARTASATGKSKTGSSSKENAASRGVASKDAASDAQLTACRVCRGVQLFCEAPDCIELGCADEDCSAAVKTEFSKCADSRCESSEHKEGAFCKVHAEKALYACDDCGDLTCWPQQCLYCDKMTCGGCVRMKCECIERPYRYQAYESELEDDEDSADAYGVLLDADDSLFADDDSCM